MLIEGTPGQHYPFDRGRHVIVTVGLRTYADETGTQGKPLYCMVSGFIGSPRDWGLLDTAWRAVLEEYAVPEFHAHEFFSRHLIREPSDSPYVGWDDQKAHQFLTDLVGGVLVRRKKILPVGGAINVPDFNSYTEGERRYFTMAHVNRKGVPKTSGAPSRPYQMGLVSLLYDAIRKSEVGAKVHFVIDRNTKEEPLALQTFRDISLRESRPVWKRLGSLTYADSNDEPGLQAADLYNYVWQRYAVLAAQGRTLGREESYVMGALKRKRSNLRVWQKAGFDALLETLTPEQRQGLKD